MRYKLGQVAKSLDRSILLFGVLIVSVNAFPQSSAGQATHHPESDQTMQLSTKQDKTPADPQVNLVTDRIVAAGVLHSSTIEEARRAYLFYSKLAGPPEPVFRVEDRTIPGSAGSIPIRMYFPNVSTRLPVLVFFHGGGFVAGGLDTHDTPLRSVTNRDCLVVSVGYRLAPEYPYPAAPNDAYVATKWVADHATEMGADPKRIAVGGDGAGGNLAPVVALMARDRGDPHIVLQVLIYPVLDALMGTYSWVESDDPVLTSDSMVMKWGAYIPAATSQQVPYISPVSSTNLKDLPPTLIIMGEHDLLRDTAELYTLNLKTAGVPVHISRYANVIHSFFLMAGVLDAGKKCIDETAAALQQSFNLTP